MCVVLWPTITGLPTCGTAHHNTSNRRAIKYHHGLLDSIVKRLTACWRYSNMNPKRLKTPRTHCSKCTQCCYRLNVFARVCGCVFHWHLSILFYLWGGSVCFIYDECFYGEPMVPARIALFYIGVGLCTVTIKSFIKSLNLILIHSLGSSEEA